MEARYDGGGIKWNKNMNVRVICMGPCPMIDSGMQPEYAHGAVCHQIA